MAKIQYMILEKAKMTREEEVLIRQMTVVLKLNSCVENERFYVVGRYGVNLSTLRKLIKNG